MKIIYIAGKYNSATIWGLYQNICHAENAARKLWGEGWAVICPHKNSAFFDGIYEDKLSDRKIWIDGDLELLRRCDAIYMLSNYESSEGAKTELALAKELNLEIYYE